MHTRLEVGDKINVTSGAEVIGCDRSECQEIPNLPCPAEAFDLRFPVQDKGIHVLINIQQMLFLTVVPAISHD